MTQERVGLARIPQRIADLVAGRASLGGRPPRAGRGMSASP